MKIRSFVCPGALVVAAAMAWVKPVHAQDIGGFVQGIINGATSQNGGWGQPNHGGQQNGWGNNQSGWGGHAQPGSNWFNNVPQYRTETQRVWNDANESYEYRHVRVPNGQSTQVNPGAIIGDIGRIIDSMPPPMPSQPVGHQQPQYYRPQPQYHHQPQYTTKPIVKQQPQATLKANALPPKPPAEAKRNTAVTADPASFALCEHTAEEAQKKAQEKMDNLGKEIETIDPDVAKDPTVVGAAKAINDKIAKGEEVTQEDFDNLRAALAAAAAAKGINLDNPADVKGQTIDAALKFQSEDIQLLSKIPALVNNSNSQGGNNLGNGLIVFNPNMGLAEVFVLPSGAVITGDPSVLGVDPSLMVPGTEWSPPEMAVVEGTMAHAMGLPVGVGDPVPDSDVDVSDWVETGVLVLNPKANVVAVSYTVNNQPFTMEPGHRQELPAETVWKIRFNRGPDLGDATYSLSDGTYFFDPGEKGWDLFRSSYKLTIDNSKNRTPFSYIVNNENFTVDARQSRDHASDYPMYVSFDRGGGDKPATKMISERDMSFAVAVNPQDQLWDLFPPDNVPKVAEKPLPRPSLHATVAKRPTETTPRPWGVTSE